MFAFEDESPRAPNTCRCARRRARCAGSRCRCRASFLPTRKASLVGSRVDLRRVPGVRPLQEADGRRLGACAAQGPRRVHRLSREERGARAPDGAQLHDLLCRALQRVPADEGGGARGRRLGRRQAPVRRLSPLRLPKVSLSENEERLRFAAHNCFFCSAGFGRRRLRSSATSATRSR